MLFCLYKWLFYNFIGIYFNFFMILRNARNLKKFFFSSFLGFLGAGGKWVFGLNSRCWWRRWWLAVWLKAMYNFHAIPFTNDLKSEWVQHFNHVRNTRNVFLCMFSFFSASASSSLFPLQLSWPIPLPVIVVNNAKKGKHSLHLYIHIAKKATCVCENGTALFEKKYIFY